MSGWLPELAAEELRLARAGDAEGVLRVQAERSARVATEPVTPEALAETAALQAEIVAVLEAGRAAAARELLVLRRGRSAVRAYGQVSVR